MNDSRSSIGRQSAVLSVLMDSPRRRFLLRELERSTGLDSNGVKGAIRLLRKSGIVIEDGDGYSLGDLPDILSAVVLSAGLKSRTMGRNIHCYGTIGSTNQEARLLAESGAPEGTLVIADEQTEGRGRLGRSWHSPAGVGLYFSLILRPAVSVDRTPALPLIAALAICRVLENKAKLTPVIKWPNDCLIGKKKVAGILVELSAELDRVNYVILGMGINVNNRRKDFPAAVRTIATSIAIETGAPINRPEILRAILYEFEKSYDNFLRYGFRFIGPELTKRSAVLGKRITVRIGPKKIGGRALSFDSNGALRLRTKDGVRTISAGEVTLR